MATTFLTLTNELLRRLNEVTLTTDTFAGAKNVQAIAKDSINSSIREILQDGHEFPFLKTTQSQTLTAGTGTYDFPSDMSSVDWDTFYLKTLTSESNTAKALPTISEDKATPGLFCSNLFISVLISSNASSLSLPARERT